MKHEHAVGNHAFVHHVNVSPVITGPLALVLSDIFT